MGIVLHIGAPKTGTTYLQEWLSLNAPVLADHNIGAPSSLSSHRLGVEGLDDEARLQRPDIRLIKKVSLQEALQEVVGAYSGFATVVVSSEYFSESSPQKVAAMCEAAGARISQVVCYLRRQDAICASGFAEAVKTLGESAPVRGASYTPMLDWHVLHNNWREAFPAAQMVFRNFDRIRREANIEVDFGQIIGARAVPTKTVGTWINPSFAAEITEVARRMNKAGVAFSRAALMELQRNQWHQPFAFSQKVTTQFEKAYLANNQRLAAAFPGEFDDFAVPGWEPRGTDCTDNLTDERLFRILAQSLNYSESKTEELMKLRRYADTTAEELGAVKRYAEAKDEECAFLDHARASLQREYDLKRGQIDDLLRMREEELRTHEEQLRSPRFLARCLWQAACARLRAKLGRT